jgi:hypothetical protein
MLLANVQAGGDEFCGPISEKRQGNRQFFVGELAGKVAWLKDGESSSTFHLLDDCNTLYIKKAERLYFVINNVFEPRDGDGKASFVAVQVARLQSTEQKAGVVVERNDDWIRDNIVQPGFAGHEIKVMPPNQFFELHKKSPFNDQTLRFGQWWWHATPAGGSFSSSYDPEKWSWDEELFRANSNRVLLSNRLYGFKFNADGNSGVPFDIRVKGTQQVNIRVFSPLWPETVGVHVIKLRRQ